MVAGVLIVVAAEVGHGDRGEGGVWSGDGQREAAIWWSGNGAEEEHQ